MGIIDWAADKVQTATGEKERRRIVQEIKDFVSKFKNDVNNSIIAINNIIQEFNDLIGKINKIRSNRVQQNIDSLKVFLGMFGTVDFCNSFVSESEKKNLVLPEKAFAKKEEYINNIDWDKDEVFSNTFFLTPIGMAIKTKKQNLSMKEELAYLTIEAESTLNQLKIVEFSSKQDYEIAKLYMSCIELISSYIEKAILPELEMIESFLHVNILKNEIIAGNKIENIEFTNNLNILNNSYYQNHYNFIKNTLAFYMVSCKIYNTPILTKLINRETDEFDVSNLQDNKQLLLKQQSNVQYHMTFSRGE